MSLPTVTAPPPKFNEPAADNYLRNYLSYVTIMRKIFAYTFFLIFDWMKRTIRFEGGGERLQKYSLLQINIRNRVL